MVGVILTMCGICAGVTAGVLLGERLGVIAGPWSVVIKVGCGFLLVVIVVGAARSLFGPSSGPFALGITAAVLLLPEWVGNLADDVSAVCKGERFGNLMMTAVIALHHIPEGMAAGISCAVGGRGCIAVCAALVLHTVPETMVLMPMSEGNGYPRGWAYGAAAVSGAMEILGLILGYCI